METFSIYCHRRLPQVLSHSEMSFRAPQGPFTAWVREYPSESVYPVCLECAWDERLTIDRFASGVYRNAPAYWALGRASLVDGALAGGRGWPDRGAPHASMTIRVLLLGLACLLPARSVAYTFHVYLPLASEHVYEWVRFVPVALRPKESVLRSVLPLYTYSRTSRGARLPAPHAGYQRRRTNCPQLPWAERRSRPRPLFRNGAK